MAELLKRKKDTDSALAEEYSYKELTQWEQFVYEAFISLSGTRSLGTIANAISHSEFVAWCTIQSYAGYYNLKDLWYLIKGLDITWLEWDREKLNNATARSDD